jgi:hypothetical protein
LNHDLVVVRGIGMVHIMNPDEEPWPVATTRSKLETFLNVVCPVAAAYRHPVQINIGPSEVFMQLTNKTSKAYEGALCARSNNVEMVMRVGDVSYGFGINVRTRLPFTPRSVVRWTSHIDTVNGTVATVPVGHADGLPKRFRAVEGSDEINAFVRIGGTAYRFAAPPTEYQLKIQLPVGSGVRHGDEVVLIDDSQTLNDLWLAHSNSSDTYVMAEEVVKTFRVSSNRKVV